MFKTTTTAALLALVHAADPITDEYINNLITKIEPPMKPEYVPMTFDNKLEEFTLSNMLDSIDDEGIFSEFVTEAKETWMSQYRKQVEDLPPVCDLGHECRVRIQEATRATIRSDWEKKISKITGYLRDFNEQTNTAMAAAYDEAYLCEHGCQCQHIETQYTFLKSQIAKFDEEIEVLANRQFEVMESILNVNEECDFSLQAAQWETRKSQIDGEWEAKLAAVQAWDEDDWEMEDVIDQDKFMEDNEFRYESDIFDKQTAE